MGYSAWEPKQDNFYNEQFIGINESQRNIIINSIEYCFNEKFLPFLKSELGI